MCINFPFGAAGPSTFCLGTFEPYQGVAAGGIYSTFAFLFNLVFIIMFLLWIVSIGLAVFDYIRSEGQAELMEQGRNRFENIVKGLSLGLVGFVVVSVVGILFGAGTPFDWPKVLAQCPLSSTAIAPRDDRIYLNAEKDLINLAIAAGAPSGTQIDAYCCDNVGWSWINAGGPPPFAGPGINCELFDTTQVP